MPQIVGNWTVPVPASFVRRETGHHVMFDDGERLVEISAYTFKFENISLEDRASIVSMFTENFRAKEPDEEDCDFKNDDLRGKGVIREEEVKDDTWYWFLRGSITNGEDDCSVAIRFQNRVDRAWAADLFKSIRLTKVGVQ
jgi:hypothetical protein